jgi:hypothetical protein
VFGLMASSSWSKSKDECGSAGNCPNHDASVSDHDSAVSQSTVSTIGIIGGGVLLAAGVVLFATAPKPKEGAPAASLRVAPSVGPQGGGLVVAGSLW